MRLKIKVYYMKRRKHLGKKRENVGYQHLLLFPTGSSKGFFLSLVKNLDCIVQDRLQAKLMKCQYPKSCHTLRNTVDHDLTTKKGAA